MLRVLWVVCIAFMGLFNYINDIGSVIIFGVVAITCVIVDFA